MSPGGSYPILLKVLPELWPGPTQVAAHENLSQPAHDLFTML
jgi:hypothetical protein